MSTSGCAHGKNQAELQSDLLKQRQYVSLCVHTCARAWVSAHARKGLGGWVGGCVGVEGIPKRKNNIFKIRSNEENIRTIKPPPYAVPHPALPVTPPSSNDSTVTNWASKATCWKINKTWRCNGNEKLTKLLHWKMEKKRKRFVSAKWITITIQ